MEITEEKMLDKLQSTEKVKTAGWGDIELDYLKEMVVWHRK